MGLPWFRVYADMPDHPKSLRLGVLLKDRNAFAYVIRLWAWCARVAPEGRFLSEQVEEAAGWRGKAGAFLVAALQPMPDGKPGWLEDGGGGWVIAHDWDDEQGAHAAKIERDRKASEDRRAARKSQKVAKKSRDYLATNSRPSRDLVALEGERDGEREEKQQQPVARPQAVSIPPPDQRIPGLELRVRWNATLAEGSTRPSWVLMSPGQETQADLVALKFPRSDWDKFFTVLRRSALLNGQVGQRIPLTPQKLLREAERWVSGALNGEWDTPGKDLPDELSQPLAELAEVVCGAHPDRAAVNPLAHRPRCSECALADLHSESRP